MSNAYINLTTLLSARGYDKGMYFTHEECSSLFSLINARDSRIAELEAAQRWIPVTERLPELGAPILFYDSILERINKGTCTAMNSDNTNLHWFTDDDLFYFGNRSEYITHWMPLPKLPEVQE